MPSRNSFGSSVAKREAPGTGRPVSRLSTLLGEHEPAVCRVVNPEARTPLLLTCDHASWTVPESLGDLGLPVRELTSHIGWDPGAAEVTLLLAKRFDATAVLSGYSRLVVDCNRKPGSEHFIPRVSHGVRVPGNARLSPQEVAQRRDTLFSPYHEAIAKALSLIRERGATPIYLAVHSFTPRLNGFNRPWHFGVLWDEDGRLARPLIAALRGFPGIAAGDNEPYSARDHFDFSQEFHASSAGIPSALVEIRSDLIREPAGVTRHAGLLGDALERTLDNLGELYEPA